MKTAYPRAISAILLVALHGGSIGAGAEEGVGKAAAVRTDARGIPAGAAERILAVGDPAFANERIVTSATGEVALVFLDESTLSVGPSSSIVIDQFVYDPKATNNALSVQLQKGVARFIGGRISKDRGVDVKTPSATISIRGGIVIVSTPVPGGEGGAQGLLVLGTMTCSSRGEIRVVTTPGTICIVAATIEVHRASQSETTALLAALIGTGQWAGEATFDASKIEGTLPLRCGSANATHDPSCTADAGQAGVYPEPLGHFHDAAVDTQLNDQLEQPPPSQRSFGLDPAQFAPHCQAGTGSRSTGLRSAACE